MRLLIILHIAIFIADFSNANGQITYKEKWQTGFFENLDNDGRYAYTYDESHNNQIVINKLSGSTYAFYLVSKVEIDSIEGRITGLKNTGIERKINIIDRTEESGHFSTYIEFRGRGSRKFKLAKYIWAESNNPTEEEIIKDINNQMESSQFSFLKEGRSLIIKIYYKAPHIYNSGLEHWQIKSETLIFTLDGSTKAIEYVEDY